MENFTSSNRNGPMGAAERMRRYRARKTGDPAAPPPQRPGRKPGPPKPPGPGHRGRPKTAEELDGYILRELKDLYYRAGQHSDHIWPDEAWKGLGDDERPPGWEETIGALIHLLGDYEFAAKRRGTSPLPRASYYYP